MAKISYIVEGRETSRCWQDDANMRVVHGPAESLSTVSSPNEIPRVALAYFAAKGSAPADLEYFVTVTERDSRGGNRGQRVFAFVDFADPGGAAGEVAALTIASRLIANGDAMGVSA